MKVLQHAWILLITIGTAVAEDSAPGKARPEGAKKPGKEDHRGDDRNGGRKMPNLWEKADTDGNGLISASEFAAMERMTKLPEKKRLAIFARLDKNGDGQIDRKEIPRRRPDGRRLLEKVDKNKDGRVVYEEFLNLGFVARLPEEKQRALFAKMDRDKDGALTSKDHPRDRFRPDGKRGPKNGKPNPMHLVESLDENGDRALTFEEFRKARFIKEKGEDEQEDSFEKMDRNGDLKIDRLDFPKAEKKPDAAP